MRLRKTQSSKKNKFGKRKKKLGHLVQDVKKKKHNPKNNA